MADYDDPGSFHSDDRTPGEGEEDPPYYEDEEGARESSSMGVLEDPRSREPEGMSALPMYSSVELGQNEFLQEFRAEEGGEAQMEAAGHNSPRPMPRPVFPGEEFQGMRPEPHGADRDGGAQTRSLPVERRSQDVEQTAPKQLMAVKSVEGTEDTPSSLMDLPSLPGRVMRQPSTPEITPANIQHVQISHDQACVSAPPDMSTAQLIGQNNEISRDFSFPLSNNPSLSAADPPGSMTGPRQDMHESRYQSETQQKQGFDFRASSEDLRTQPEINPQGINIKIKINTFSSSSTTVSSSTTFSISPANQQNVVAERQQSVEVSVTNTPAIAGVSPTLASGHMCGTENQRDIHGTNPNYPDVWPVAGRQSQGMPRGDICQRQPKGMTTDSQLGPSYSRTYIPDSGITTAHHFDASEQLADDIQLADSQERGLMGEGRHFPGLCPPVPDGNVMGRTPNPLQIDNNQIGVTRPAAAQPDKKPACANIPDSNTKLLQTQTPGGLSPAGQPRLTNPPVTAVDPTDIKAAAGPTNNRHAADPTDNRQPMDNRPTAGPVLQQPRRQPEVQLAGVIPSTVPRAASQALALWADMTQSSQQQEAMISPKQTPKQNLPSAQNPPPKQTLIHHVASAQKAPPKQTPLQPRASAPGTQGMATLPPAQPAPVPDGNVMGRTPTPLQIDNNQIGVTRPGAAQPDTKPASAYIPDSNTKLLQTQTQGRPSPAGQPRLTNPPVTAADPTANKAVVDPIDIKQAADLTDNRQAADPKDIKQAADPTDNRQTAGPVLQQPGSKPAVQLPGKIPPMVPKAASLALTLRADTTQNTQQLEAMAPPKQTPIQPLASTQNTPPKQTLIHPMASAQNTTSKQTPIQPLASAQNTQPKKTLIQLGPSAPETQGMATFPPAQPVVKKPEAPPMGQPPNMPSAAKPPNTQPAVTRQITNPTNTQPAVTHPITNPTNTQPAVTHPITNPTNTQPAVATPKANHAVKLRQDSQPVATLPPAQPVVKMLDAQPRGQPPHMPPAAKPPNTQPAVTRPKKNPAVMQQDSQPLATLMNPRAEPPESNNKASTPGKPGPGQSGKSPDLKLPGTQLGTKPLYRKPPGTDPGTKPLDRIPPGIDPGTKPLNGKPQGTASGIKPLDREHPGTDPGTKPLGRKPPGTDPGTKPPDRKLLGTKPPDHKLPGTKPPDHNRPGTDQETGPLEQKPPGTDPGTKPPDLDPTGTDPGTKPSDLDPTGTDPDRKPPDADLNRDQNDGGTDGDNMGEDHIGLPSTRRRTAKKKKTEEANSDDTLVIKLREKDLQTLCLHLDRDCPPILNWRYIADCHLENAHLINDMESKADKSGKSVTRLMLKRPEFDSYTVAGLKENLKEMGPLGKTILKELELQL